MEITHMYTKPIDKNNPGRDKNCQCADSHQTDPFPPSQPLQDIPGERTNLFKARSTHFHNSSNDQTLKIASIYVCGLKTRLEYPDFTT